MLTFMRNKVVGIEKGDEHTLVAHGFLDDDIYGLELVVSIGFPERRILSIEGRFNRYTTPECPKAIPVLQQAVGLIVHEEGFAKTVNRAIGRKGCRHFANLLLECCATAAEAARTVMGEDARPEQERPSVEAPGSGPEGVRQVSSPGRHGARAEVPNKEAGATTIDLHVHTSPASPCSVASVEAHIEEARRIGLDGICLTDHNFVWEQGVVEALRQKHGFLVLGGSEITTDQGDVLVFGLAQSIRGIIRIEELRTMVRETGGYMIAAHPFRGFLTFGVGKLGLTAERAMGRPLFKYVDAVEVLNARVTEKENGLAAEVAAGLGIPGTGGSDSHEISETGIYATRFPASITNEGELVEALKSGEGRPVAFRRERGH